MKYSIDNSWCFYEGDCKFESMQRGYTKAGNWDFGFSAINFDDSNWTKVDLPHDFVIKHEPTFVAQSWGEGSEIPEMGSIDSLRTSIGSLSGGIAWYRKKITFNSLRDDERIFIKFDGIYRDCKLYVNEYFVASNMSGYIGFEADITDFINEGENLIAIKCDASESEGWWYQGGGIYRHVWIDRRKDVYISDVYAKSKVLGDSAAFYIQAEIMNKSALEFFGNVSATITDKANNTFNASTEISAKSFKYGKAEIEIMINNPYLWSCETPDLYNVKLTLSNGDIYELTTGIRDIKFDNEKGCFLNGKPIKIKGVCEHQDHAGVGVAIFDGLYDYKVKKLKSMGTNAIRMSHNPCSEEFLNACDRNGVLVMSENRLLSSGEDNMSQLRRLILRDRNHPCVFMLSIANEESKTQFSYTGAKNAKTLYNYTKSLWNIDITEALLFWDIKNKCLITDMTLPSKINKYVDVTGQNYNHAVWDEFKEEYKNKPFISTEQRSIPQTRGYYITDHENCRVGVMDKDNGFLFGEGEEVWEFVDTRDYVSGLFIWTGFDYHGEPSPYKWPAVASQFGVLDLCGFEKDGFYYYKAMWDSTPSIHILPHWNKIDGMNEERQVWCYSNCDEIELILNGKIIDKKQTEKYRHTEFTCTYEPGELKAIGYRNGQIVCEDSVVTSKEAYAIKAQIEAQYDENGRKFSIVKVYTEDIDGNYVPDSDNLIVASSDAEVIGCGNGDPINHNKACINERALFSGLAQFIFEGDGEVEFTSDGLQSIKMKL